jgi:hypothetical protein
MLIRPVFCGDLQASLQALRACSACAGDYEDPDRTAWPPSRERARTRLQMEEQGGAENEAGDEAVNDEYANDNGTRDEDTNDDEFPATEL